MLCKIGDIEVWRILEMNVPILTPEDLWPNAESDVREVVERHAPGSIDAATGGLILPVQGFLLKTSQHIVLVDACVGNHKTNRLPAWHMKSDNRFMSALTAAGVGPEDIDYVLCTHLHTDHAGWNTQLVDGRWVPTFPNARYLMPAADNELYRELGGAPYVESVAPVVEAGQAEMVTPGHMLGDHITLIPTPGHTPGHASILIRHSGAEAVITGDALHSTVQCWRPEWEFIYDEDGKTAVASRKQLLGNAVEAGWKVLGSHFKLPSVGRVKAEGDAFRWEED